MRSTRKLLKFVSDGFTAAENWDGIDNFHKYDTVWTTNGLIKLDTSTWTCTFRKFYYAAKKMYKYLPKGFSLVETAAKYFPYSLLNDSFFALHVGYFNAAYIFSRQNKWS